jgi:hypothetical protein
LNRITIASIVRTSRPRIMNMEGTRIWIILPLRLELALVLSLLVY